MTTVRAASAEPAGELAAAFVRQRDALLGFAVALVRERDVAEEIVQEVGVAVLEADARGVRPGDIGAWLRGVARHRAADHWRRRARRAGLEVRMDRFERIADAVEAAFEETWLEIEATAARVRHLAACLESLAPRARQIVDERYRRGRSIEDVARVVGWRANAVKVALAKARSALVACVQRRLAAEELG